MQRCSFPFYRQNDEPEQPKLAQESINQYDTHQEPETLPQSQQMIAKEDDAQMISERPKPPQETQDPEKAQIEQKDNERGKHIISDAQRAPKGRECSGFKSRLQWHFSEFSKEYMQ